MILKPHKAQTKKITNINAKLKKTLNYANNIICWKSKNVKLNKIFFIGLNSQNC